MWFEFFEGGGADAGDVEEIAEAGVGAFFDDAVGHGFADAGELHELAAVGGVGVDFFAVEVFGGIDADLVLGVFVALLFALGGQLFPVGEAPDAALGSGGLKFEVVERGGIGIAAESGLVVGGTVDAEGAG